MTIPKLTTYAATLLNRQALGLLSVQTETRKKGGACICGGWGTDKVGNEWTCRRCWKAHKAALHCRGVQRCPR